MVRKERIIFFNLFISNYSSILYSFSFLYRVLSLMPRSSAASFLFPYPLCSGFLLLLHVPGYLRSLIQVVMVALHLAAHIQAASPQELSILLIHLYEPGFVRHSDFAILPGTSSLILLRLSSYR